MAFDGVWRSEEASVEERNRVKKNELCLKGRLFITDIENWKAMGTCMALECLMNLEDEGQIKECRRAIDVEINSCTLKLFMVMQTANLFFHYGNMLPHQTQHVGGVEALKDIAYFV